MIELQQGKLASAVAVTIHPFEQQVEAPVRNLDDLVHVKDVYMVALTDRREFLAVDRDALAWRVERIGRLDQGVGRSAVKLRPRGDNKVIVGFALAIPVLMVVLGDGEEIESNVTGHAKGLLGLAQAVTVGGMRVQVAKPHIAGLRSSRCCQRDGESDD